MEKPAVDEELRQKLANITACFNENLGLHQDIDEVQKKLMDLTNLIYEADRYIMDTWIGFNQKRGRLTPLPKSTLSLQDLGL